MVDYNKEAVQKEIDLENKFLKKWWKDKTIGKKEAKLIHALLKGWRK